MSDSGNRKSVRWKPSPRKVKKLLARLPKIYAKAPANVRKAAERIAETGEKNETPDAADLALCLLWTTEIRRPKRPQGAPEPKHRPSKQPAQAPPSDGTPDTVFAQRVRKAEEEANQRESPMIRTMRKRLRARPGASRKKGKLHIKGD